MAIMTRIPGLPPGGGGGGGVPGQTGGGHPGGYSTAPAPSGGGIFWDNSLGDLPVNPPDGLYSDPQPGTGDHAASETYAHLLRARWEDYKRRFEPYYKALNDAIRNPDVLKADLAHADRSVGLGFATAAGENRRRQARYGLHPDAATQAAMDRRRGLAKAGATVAAENATRANKRNRDMGILGGTASGVSQLVNEARGH
jgi:hypothetical protein